MVKVEDEALPGEIVEGLKAQVKPAGAAQVRVIGLSNPPTAAALTVTLADPPGLTVALWAERLRVKLAVGRGRGNKAGEHSRCASSSREIGLAGAATSGDIKSASDARIIIGTAAPSKHHIPHAGVH